MLQAQVGQPLQGLDRRGLLDRRALPRGLDVVPAGAPQPGIEEVRQGLERRPPLPSAAGARPGQLPRRLEEVVPGPGRRRGLHAGLAEQLPVVEQGPGARLPPREGEPASLEGGDVEGRGQVVGLKPVPLEVGVQAPGGLLVVEGGGRPGRQAHHVRRGAPAEEADLAGDVLLGGGRPDHVHLEVGVVLLEGQEGPVLRLPARGRAPGGVDDLPLGEPRLRQLVQILLGPAGGGERRGQRQGHLPAPGQSEWGHVSATSIASPFPGRVTWLTSAHVRGRATEGGPVAYGLCPMFPRLRPVDPQWVRVDGEDLLWLRDPLDLAGPGRVVLVPAPLVPLVAACDGTRDVSALERELRLKSGMGVPPGTVRQVLRGAGRGALAGRRPPAAGPGRCPGGLPGPAVPAGRPSPGPATRPTPRLWPPCSRASARAGRRKR